MTRESLLALSFMTLGCWGIADAANPSAIKLERTLTAIDAEDFRGRHWKIEDFSEHKYLVVAFLGTECPLAKLYTTRLIELRKKYADKGVGFVGVMSNSHDSISEIAAFARRNAVPFPLIKDAGNRIADRLTAERTPEVFLLDQDRKVKYWGRVDDQYGIGYARDFPRKHELSEAIDDLLSGSQVKTPVSRSIGCIIGRQKKPTKNAKVNYSQEVARVLRKRCTECHREGEIAPFALTEYEESSGWADMIAETVRNGRMPPWHASPEYGQFANDRSMTEEEKQILYDWAEAGAPEGDKNDLPEPKEYTEGWLLPRQPDLVVDVSPEPFEVRAEGSVRYQYFSVDPGFKEDKWLRYAEFKPGNREVVHHILGFAKPPGSGRGLGAERGYLVGYVPGTRVEPLPDGWAKKIPAGSRLIFQVHYTPIGTPQVDQSKLGMIFIDEKDVTHEIKTSSAVQPSLRLPPGDDNYVVSARSAQLQEGLLLGFSPHMHLRGKSFRYELVEPEGKRHTLLDVPEYDFNWQTFYLLDSPMPVEKNARIYCTASFDNSSKNLNNPNPNATVRWGDQTEDEMMIGYFHYAVPVDAESPSPDSLRKRLGDRIRTSSSLRIFDRLDTDKDGKVLSNETPEKLKSAFRKLDANHDGVLLRSEVELGN